MNSSDIPTAINILGSNFGDRFPSIVGTVPELLSDFDVRTRIHEQIRRERDSTYQSLWTREIDVYRAYVLGRQSITVTEKQREILKGILGHEYCDNVCQQIIGEGAARLQFLKWKSIDDVTSVALTDFYSGSNVKYVSSKVHYDMLRDGNTAVSLEWDAKKSRVRLFQEHWWNGVYGLWLKYDQEDPDCILYAVKQWNLYEGDMIVAYRRVIWSEGEMQRWISFDKVDWQPYSLPQDNGRWSFPLLDCEGRKMRVPIVHFPNGANITEQYGLSDLSGGIIASQDQINDLQMVISGAARLTGYQMYTISGAKKETDPTTGEEKTPEFGPGQVLTSTSNETRFGTLPAGDISQIIAAYNHKLKSIARVARVPLHRMGEGNPPSGEALVRAEGPAIGKAERQVDVAQVRWRNVGEIYRDLYNANSKNCPVLPEDVMISVLMEEPDRRDKMSKSTIVANIQNLISPQEALRIMEYSPEDAEKIVSEKVKYITDVTLASTPPTPVIPQGNSNGKK